MGAIPAARLYHTQYRELPPPPGMYLIQKHKMFKGTAKNLKGHYKKNKNPNDIFITQVARNTSICIICFS